MEEKPAYQKDIESIRKLMERSVKFISLSGLSGILSGVYALLGAWAANYFLKSPYGYVAAAGADEDVVVKIMLIAALVLAASLATGLWLTARNSKKAGVKIWDATSKRLLINLAIPLVAGGIFILILMARGYFEMVAPASLIFYGLALINGSPNAYEEVRYLGFSEIIVGLISACFVGYGLIFWALGFGVLHIVYGAVMYKRYDS